MAIKDTYTLELTPGELAAANFAWQLFVGAADALRNDVMEELVESGEISREGFEGSMEAISTLGIKIMNLFMSLNEEVQVALNERGKNEK